jgi:type III secretion protein S
LTLRPEVFLPEGAGTLIPVEAILDYENIAVLTTEALKLSLVVSLPAVATAAISGLLISFLQAVTSLQDASISQLAKLIVVTITILITAPWSASLIEQFARTVSQVIFS